MDFVTFREKRKDILDFSVIKCVRRSVLLGFINSKGRYERFISNSVRMFSLLFHVEKVGIVGAVKFGISLKVIVISEEIYPARGKHLGFFPSVIDPEKPLQSKTRLFIQQIIENFFP